MDMQNISHKVSEDIDRSLDLCLKLRNPYGLIVLDHLPASDLKM
jgi:hypothetical protein